jgi:hypothetical protein
MTIFPLFCSPPTLKTWQISDSEPQSLALPPTELPAEIVRDLRAAYTAAGESDTAFAEMLLKLGTPPRLATVRFDPAQMTPVEAVSLVSATIPPRPEGLLNGRTNSNGGEFGCGSDGDGDDEDVAPPAVAVHPDLQDIITVESRG